MGQIITRRQVKEFLVQHNVPNRNGLSVRRAAIVAMLLDILIHESVFVIIKFQRIKLSAKSVVVSTIHFTTGFGPRIILVNYGRCVYYSVNTNVSILFIISDTYLCYFQWYFRLVNKPDLLSHQNANKDKLCCRQAIEKFIHIFINLSRTNHFLTQKECFKVS